jgi:hypothetical protein
MHFSIINQTDTAAGNDLYHAGKLAGCVGNKVRVAVMTIYCCSNPSGVIMVVVASCKRGYHHPTRTHTLTCNYFLTTHHPRPHQDCNIDVLKMLCLYDPECGGFNSDGWLKNSTKTTVHQSQCNLYIKTAGAPASLHYLRIGKWDADFEDLPNGEQCRCARVDGGGGGGGGDLFSQDSSLTTLPLSFSPLPPPPPSPSPSPFLQAK